MKATILGIFAAIVVHVGIILFGGLLFMRSDEHNKKPVQVELISDDTVAAKADKPKDKKEEPADKPDEKKEMEAQEEQAPDAGEIIRNIEMSAANAAPALEAASLGAIEAALSGVTGSSGDFAEALTFASGGRIGGTGKAGAMADEKLEQAFSLAEIDQKPRAVFQSAPNYPSELRSRKVEGVVQVVFIVDAAGRVTLARAETSSHEAFEKPAVEAVRRWKFEPAIKGGQKVHCKMRVPIRFEPA